jgi:hypothetical protein
MSDTTKTYRVGELRPSQLLHTFGIGSVIDLPNLSVMVMGLDEWPAHHRPPVGEPRLLAAVQHELGAQVAQLRTPPIPQDHDTNTLLGVPVATFPRWMVCPYCRLLSPLDDGLFQFKQPPFYRQDQARYVHGNCQKPGTPPTVLPARFLVACEHGHLDDFPWHYFVHAGDPCPKPGQLYLREQGLSGEASDILVTCSGCKARRRMSDAFGKEGQRSMPFCRGRQPHVRSFAEEPCQEQMKTILLGASNSWFSITLSTLSVPVAVDQIGHLVDAYWHLLEAVESRQNVELLRHIGHLQPFHAFSVDAIWSAIERKRSGTVEQTTARNLKQPEWSTLSNPTTAPRLADFQIMEVEPPTAYRHLLTRVVLGERLREVSALVGFTRITSPGDFDGTEIPAEQRAPLSRTPPTWVPAVDVHGEGIFLQFAEQAIADWLSRPEVAAYAQQFAQAHRTWRRARRLDPAQGDPGLRYVLLHSFAHALIRQLALECGYTVASIRERIYALPPEDENGPMAGILLYTAAPDSEGTLGGLVRLGEPDELGRHINAALEHAQLCASDPLCAERTPLMEPAELHAAACHACLFVPETSCERGNRFLDRSLLVPTVEPERHTLAFFRRA